MGDMIVTCSSPHSRNHRVGAALAKGEKLEQILEKLGEVAEGVVTAKVARELAREAEVAMPISETVARILYDGLPPRDALDELMNRAARYEVDFDYTAELKPAAR
jgi:glycerol-3-phosphate dehydrogenase (NAD(P)+)